MPAYVLIGNEKINPKEGNAKEGEGGYGQVDKEARGLRVLVP